MHRQIPLIATGLQIQTLRYSFFSPSFSFSPHRKISLDGRSKNRLLSEATPEKLKEVQSVKGKTTNPRSRHWNFVKRVTFVGASNPHFNTCKVQCAILPRPSSIHLFYASLHEKDREGTTERRQLENPLQKKKKKNSQMGVAVMPIVGVGQRWSAVVVWTSSWSWRSSMALWDREGSG